MRSQCILCVAGFLIALPAAPLAGAEQVSSAPLPDIRQLMHEVEDHQKQLDKVRENYTYSSHAAPRTSTRTGR